LPSNINEVINSRPYNESPPLLINVATSPCKVKLSPIAVTQQHQKGTKFHNKKNRSLSVHIVELSTAVEKVD